MTTEINTAAATVTTNKPSHKGPNFGDGRYSNVMREAYSDTMRLLTSDASKAEAFARQLGQDLGRAMAESPIAIRYGRTSKDGKLTLKEASTVKGVTARNSLTLGRILSMANDINGTKLAVVESLKLTGNLAEWFVEL